MKASETTSAVDREEPERPTETGETVKMPPTGGSFLLEPVIQPVFTREKFSEEQKEIERMVLEVARQQIAPRRDELETPDKELTMELMHQVAELGLTAIDIPEKYGGMELDKTTSTLVVEALTTCGSASWIVTFSCHVGIATLPIVFFGTEEQKAKYLPKLASAEYLGAYALTEPESGSDVNDLRTTASISDNGSHYILNGSKMWITNGGWADLYIVFANLEGEGITAFLVERGTEGLTTGAEEHKLGIKGSSTTAVNLDGVQIPRENLLGMPGEGMPIALNALNIGRYKLGAADLGGCKAVVDQATGYALERLQFGQPIAYFEAIRKKLADMVVRTYMLDGATYRTVGLMDERISELDAEADDYQQNVVATLEDYAIESSIVKILGSETMARIIDHGVQIYGGYGFSEEYPMARVYRDARIDRLFEGTNEINRMVIYGFYLKKTLMEELSLREAAAGWAQGAELDTGPFAWEVAALDAGRRLTIKCLFEAVSLYGQDLRNAQIIGEDLADLAIGYFAASAAINRLWQLHQETPLDRAQRSLGRLVMATYLEDAWRLLFRLRPILFADSYGRRSLAAFDEEMQRLQLSFNPVADIQILTDDLYDRGGYRF